MGLADAFDFRQSSHLPNLREGGQPPDPQGLPRQRRGTTPQMHGRYPDYDVLEESDHWDQTTRALILSRVRDVPAIRFFTKEEAEPLRAFCDVVLAQDSEPRIPVLEMVDRKLYDGRLDGFQHDFMPDDREVWRRVARGIDEAARERGAESFAEAGGAIRAEVCKRMSDGELSGGAWEDMPSDTAWSVVMRAILSEFYSHPWAWNEIGFGGPAYPRGYARLGIGNREAWEGVEAFDVDPVNDTRRRGIE